ncbi:interleukin-4 receptor subunit alpha-like [Rhinatrema bivittatum]|uniref:interleukin-4 receptor subunit alpha-like n=1 Tax=Rhinatrema bivittatum TaxID=194408 RepID=UPI00112D1D16|nr:interleukin-4 receptor subunit alpha-like [Rhinatrema bivittatum]
MGRCQPASMSLFWLLLISLGLQQVKTDGQAKNLECYNDYDKEMVCTWELEHLAFHCRDQYLRMYKVPVNEWRNYTCIPKKLKVGDSLSLSKCTCTILVSKFGVFDEYVVEILSNETVALSGTVLPWQTVKPKAPRNLTVEKDENGNFILHWDKSYQEPNLLYDRLSFEVAYYNKQNPEKIHLRRHEQLESRHEILGSELEPGDYVAKVRSLPRDFSGQWSEWSAFEWRKESELSLQRLLQIIVPLFSILTLALIAVCYVCFVTYKKEWWDNIPDPAKSNFAVKNFNKSQSSSLRKVQCIHDQKTSFHGSRSRHVKSIFGKWLAKSLPCSLGEYGLREDYTQGVKCRVDSCQGGSQTEGERAKVPGAAGRTLVPEHVLVERFEICPREAADKAFVPKDPETLEDKATEEAKDKNEFAFDSAIHDLFQKLIEADTWQPNSDILADEPELFNRWEIENVKQEIYRVPDHQSGSNVFSFCMDEFPLEQNRRANKNNFLQSIKASESSHHGCKSDIVYLEQKSRDGFLHQSCSEVQEDLLRLMLDSQDPPAPGGHGGCTPKPDVFVDADYTSFESTVSKGCPENLDLHLSSSQDGEDLPLFPHEAMHARGGSSGSVSPADCVLLNMSGYQSFNSAVKQEKMQGDDTFSLGSPNETDPEGSGYKPFDCESLQSSYADRGMGDPDSPSGKDGECDLADGPVTAFFKETLKENGQNAETGGAENQSGCRDSGSQYYNSIGTRNGPPNTKTPEGDSSIFFALTFDIWDHLKNFGNSAPGNPLLSEVGNRECSSLGCLAEPGGDPPFPYPGTANPSLAQRRKSWDSGTRERAAAGCIPPGPSPPSPTRPSPSPKCQTKFENISYFIQPWGGETVLALKRKQISPSDEGGGGAKQRAAQLTEDVDSEGNFYMEVTTQADLQPQETIEARETLSR